MFRTKVEAYEAAEICWEAIRHRAKLALKRIYPEHFSIRCTLADEDFFPIHAHIDFIFLWINVANLLAKEQEGINQNQELMMLTLTSETYAALFLKNFVRQQSIESIDPYPAS